MLGRGGMGTVVRALDTKTGVRVAIKAMRPDLAASAVAVKRFLREAKAASMLESEHVVRVLDVVQGSGLFLVMEHLEGHDLDAEIKKSGPVAPPIAIAYVLQALDAIVAAHRAGIIHRDLKPENLFLTKEGVVKVLDFGLAKHLGEKVVDGERTSADSLLGSPWYMSPEQFASPSTVDGRTDVWSLGATLFHLVAGKPPFVDLPLPMLALRLTTTDAPTLCSVAPAAPPELDAVVARCLARDTKRRYASAAALRDALLELHGGPDVPLVRRFAQRLLRWRR